MSKNLFSPFDKDVVCSVSLCDGRLFPRGKHFLEEKVAFNPRF